MNRRAGRLICCMAAVPLLAALSAAVRAGANEGATEVRAHIRKPDSSAAPADSCLPGLTPQNDTGDHSAGETSSGRPSGESESGAGQDSTLPDSPSQPEKTPGEPSAPPSTGIPAAFPASLAAVSLMIAAGIIVRKKGRKDSP